MLVDFGSAVDLTTVGDDDIYPNPSNIADVRLWGDVKEDKSPVMNRWIKLQDSGWSHGIDMLGVCASAFMLLFSVPMTISLDKATKRMKLSKSLRPLGLGQRPLWETLFDTLLNYRSDDDGRNALASVRMNIEVHLQQHNAQLVAALEHQARRLARYRKLP
jgi:hypothetical protein